MWVRYPGQEDPLEKEIPTHSSIPAWEIPRTEEPGRLQFIEPQTCWALQLKQQQRTTVIPLQCRVSFCCITTSISSMYMHIPFLLTLRPIPYPHSTLLGVMEPQAELPGLYGDTLSTLLSQFIPPSFSHCAHTCSLHLHLYSCPANRFICTVFSRSHICMR